MIPEQELLASDCYVEGVLVDCRVIDEYVIFVEIDPYKCTISGPGFERIIDSFAYYALGEPKRFRASISTAFNCPAEELLELKGKRVAFDLTVLTSASIIGYFSMTSAGEVTE
ncbi:hypothetical protein [Furfurilactobacillus curtus]|uniref:Uncharacterized protein n=1 Tax=Furfurilactobacillus curtus TaxID=1746200 RepID=A0ABQ5JMK0_9LACO